MLRSRNWKFWKGRIIYLRLRNPECQCCTVGGGGLAAQREEIQTFHENKCDGPRNDEASGIDFKTARPLAFAGLVRGSGNATGRQGFSAGKRYGNAPKKLAIFNSTWSSFLGQYLMKNSLSLHSQRKHEASSGTPFPPHHTRAGS